MVVASPYAVFRAADVAWFQAVPPPADRRAAQPDPSARPHPSTIAGTAAAVGQPRWEGLIQGELFAAAGPWS